MYQRQHKMQIYDHNAGKEHTLSLTHNAYYNPAKKFAHSLKLVFYWEPM